MMKSAEMLVNNHRVLSGLCSLSLIFFVVAFTLILANEYAFAIPAVQAVMALVFGGIMLFSLCGMIAATYYVIRQRAELSDPYMFLAITWILPYLGISILLGWPNIVRVIKRT